MLVPMPGAEGLSELKEEYPRPMKTENIIIRVSPLEKEKIKKDAEKQQMTVSEYIIYLCRKERGN